MMWNIFSWCHLPNQSPIHTATWDLGFLLPLSRLFFFYTYFLPILSPLPGTSASTLRGNIKSMKL